MIFWLDFGAVLTVLLFYTEIYKLLKQANKYLLLLKPHAFYRINSNIVETWYPLIIILGTNHIISQTSEVSTVKNVWQFSSQDIAVTI